MRRFLRWLLNPLVRFATKYEPIIINDMASDGRLYVTVTDGMGTQYCQEMTPDEFRGRAWKMICLADRVEESLSERWSDAY